MMNKHLFFIFHFSLFMCAVATAQVPYGYAPGSPTLEECSAIGGGKNEFVQGLVRFDPAIDPALARMKGMQILGVRVCLRADYKQARQKRSAILASVGTPENIVRTTYADFTEGWNEVLFEEPLTISNEPFYLGAQAYETIGTPYPLMAYAAATVPQACFINLAKKKWEEQPDRGTLLIEAILPNEAEAAIQHTAYAQNTTHPQTVAPDTDFQGGLYIHNFSAEPLTTIDLSMQGEGAETPTVRTIELPQPIPARGGTVITASLRSGTAEGSAVNWSAAITAFNGQPAQAGRPGTTPLFVTQDNFLRTPLIEEFTSQRCVACPQMAYFLDKAFQQYEGDYVYVTHHTGFAEDAFTTQPDREIVYIFGGYENEYNPAIMYNRAVFEGENGVIQGIRDMSPEPYLEAIATAATMPAAAEVKLSMDDRNVCISGRVARDLITTPLYLSCYLVEDGITTQNYPQKGMDDDDAPADLKDVFRHNGIILHYFNTEAIGDLLTVNESGHYSVSYPLAEKEGFGGTRRRLVAFVHKVNKANLRDNAVLNAAQLILGSTDGIQKMNNEKLTMNNEDGAVYDLSGRKMVNDRSAQRDASHLKKSVHKNLSKGIYMMNGRKFIR